MGSWIRRRKWRLWAGLVAAALVISGLGWSYLTIVAGPDSALRLAETFSFRRMKVAQVGDTRTYRFLYVTNRVELNGLGANEKVFGNEREEKLKFGSFDTEIEPTLGIGMLINPTDWIQNDVIQVQDVRQLDEPTFIEQVRQLVEGSPLRALLVVVHGFRETFPSAVSKTAFLGHVLDINAPVLLFDWPGNQGTSPRGYRRAQRVAEASGAELASALELIIGDVQPDRLWLFANSLGAQVVADAFSLLYEKADLADAETEIEDVILTAPDVDASEFDNRFKQEISALTRQLTVYVSSNDRALQMSRIVNWARRRGESSLRPSELEEAVNAAAELLEPDDDLITLVDVTPVNRTRNFHNFSLETPEFFDDLFLRLTEIDDPQSRLLYRARTPDGTNYWVLTRGR